jgi:hypothetical protein
MSEDKPTTEMNVTQFVALGFRLCSIYCGYEVFRTSMDLIGAMQVLHLRAGSIVPPWWAFILWKGCVKLAHIVTEGLDKVN